MKRASGFTLIELLVVITIIGILVSLLMPAIGSVQESGRRTICKNNLSQIGKGAQAHVEKYGWFPSSGWGYRWVGDPDRGADENQPGGWIYNLLPFIGQDAIHQIGAGMSNSQKHTALQPQKSAVLPTFICPTRRRVMAYPAKETSINAGQPSTLAKTDYAANGGTVLILGVGPNDMSCLDTFPNCQWKVQGGTIGGSLSFNDLVAALKQHYDGISSVISKTRPAHITDGLSRTIFAGEKYMNVNRYYTGNGGADNNSMYQGNDWDTNRWCNGNSLPMQDTPGVGNCDTFFGSAHTSGVNFVMCDGSVQTINYSIDGAIYTHLGDRNDGAKDEPF